MSWTSRRSRSSPIVTARVVEAWRGEGVDKPVVASLAGDTESRGQRLPVDHRIFHAVPTERPAAAQLSGTRPENPPTDDGNNKGVRTSRPLEEVKR